MCVSVRIIVRVVCARAHAVTEGCEHASMQLVRPVPVLRTRTHIGAGPSTRACFRVHALVCGPAHTHLPLHAMMQFAQIGRVCCMPMTAAVGLDEVRIPITCMNRTGCFFCLDNTDGSLPLIKLCRLLVHVDTVNLQPMVSDG
jgi:hypothetical protein